MSSAARSFQAAARLFRAAGRSGGFSACDRVVRSGLRATGVFNASAWMAPAAQQPTFHARTQPSYGFASQGVVAVTDGFDCSCTGSSESGSTPATCCNDEAAESLSSGDSEGVIPHHDSGPLPAPPWNPAPPPLPPLSSLSLYNSDLRCAQCRPALPLTAAAPFAQSTVLSSCTGVRLPLAAAVRKAVTLPPYGARLYGNHAVQRAAGDGDTDAGESPFTLGAVNPSRPRHAVPVPHLPTAEDAAREHLSAEEYRERHGIVVEDPELCGSNQSVPEPFQRFADAPFPPAVMDVLRSARYGAPSPIQAQAWSIALGGRDLVAIASTGSGKTLGFLLPALLHIKARGGDPALGPTAVVLAPTRELARQIEAEARRFGHVVVSGDDAGGESSPPSNHRHHRSLLSRHERRGFVGLRTACVYGGATRGGQLDELRRRPQLIIATPGRLLDFIEAGDIRMKQVSFLVLDEADRMLDMGFEEQIAEIARAMPSERQTLFFSATWPNDVRHAAAAFAKHRPVRLFIGDVQSKPVAATSITQRVQVLDGADKLDALEAYLREQLLGPQGDGEEGEEGGGQRRRQQQGSDVRRAIVFCETKAGCDHLTHNINSTMPFQAASLHGDKSQSARDYALAKFKAGRVPVLVATDVAARGLDIPNITCVVNYEMPNDIEMYVHRIGRTGRAGAKGHSLALVNRNRDGGVAKSLVEVLEGAGQEVPQELRRLADRSRARGGYSGQRRQGGGWGRRGGGGGGGGSGWGRGSRGEGGRGFRDRERDGYWGRVQEEERGGGDEEEGGHGGKRRHHADGWRSVGGGAGRGRGGY